MKKHYKIFFLVASFLSLGMSAQQDAQYTQYMYNTVSVNPAYAGTRGVLSVVGLHRSQWVGIDGAPRTQTLAVHSPIGLGRVGLGGSVVNDEIGPVQETYFNLDFSYTIPTSEKGDLSFGLKAGGRLLDTNFDQLTGFGFGGVRGDGVFEEDIDNRFSPNVGIGLYYHTDKGYLGLSAPNLLETKHFDKSNSANNTLLARERINYYLIGGYTFDLNDDVKFKPAVLSKLVFGAPLQVDLSANFLLYEKLTLGAAYRWSAAFSALVAFQVSDSTLIGFAYDKETTELGNTKFNDGSFELMVRFELFKKYSRLITPRFF